MQHYNACLLNVSFSDIHERIRPSGRHILWHYKGHTGGIYHLSSTIVFRGLHPERDQALFLETLGSNPNLSKLETTQY